METAHLAVFKDKIVEYLSQYLYTGGMPLAVKMYADTRNFGDVREVQDAIIKSYYADFAKHIPGRDIAKVRQIWDSVPAQLGKENKRFLYSDMKAGSRGRDFETALQWLVDSGLVLRLNRVSLPNLPLAGYAESAVFKLYLPDVGLLSALTGLGPRTYLEGPEGIFNHFKGVLAEQFVLQELRANAPHPPVYYWANGKNTAEIEFVIQSENQIIPIEVKAGKNIKSKSLAVYREQFAPETAIQTSLEDFEKAGSLCRIPLFAIGQWRGWLLQHGEETARRRSG
jgi:predicted AAA+ superfamily ATPase